MASQKIIEFSTFTFKPSAQSDPSQPPASLTDTLTQLKSLADVHSIYIGRQIEEPSVWYRVTTWPSTAAREAFDNSPAFAPWHLAFSSDLDSYQPGVRVRVSDGSANLDAALGAPCTEVFTCYGVDEGFLDGHMKPFADGVEAGKPLGFHGSAYGEFEQEREDKPTGPAVRILLGWDSKEAHLAQRGEGKGMRELEKQS